MSHHRDYPPENDSRPAGWQTSPRNMKSEVILQFLKREFTDNFDQSFVRGKIDLDQSKIGILQKLSSQIETAIQDEGKQNYIFTIFTELRDIQNLFEEKLKQDRDNVIIEHEKNVAELQVSL